MENDTQEITRQYRLKFNHRETFWDDTIPSETIFCVTGMKTTETIDRTGLLVWSLLNISRVETADLAFQGWIRILVRTSDDFDETSFKRDVANVVNEVKQVRSVQDFNGPEVEMAEAASGAVHPPSPFHEVQAAS